MLFPIAPKRLQSNPSIYRPFMISNSWHNRSRVTTTIHTLTPTLCERWTRGRRPPDVSHPHRRSVAPTEIHRQINMCKGHATGRIFAQNELQSSSSSLSIGVGTPLCLFDLSGLNYESDRRTDVPWCTLVPPEWEQLCSSSSFLGRRKS